MLATKKSMLVTTKSSWISDIGISRLSENTEDFQVPIQIWFALFASRTPWLSLKSKFVKSLKRESLKDLQNLKSYGGYDATVAIETLMLLHEKNFSLSSLIMHDFEDCKINEPDLENFFEKHCSNLKVLELKTCGTNNELRDSNYYGGPFTKLVSRNVFGFAIAAHQKFIFRSIIDRQCHRISFYISSKINFWRIVSALSTGSGL